MTVKNFLQTTKLKTPLGTMLAIADDQSLHLLKFLDQTLVEQEISKLKEKTKSTIIPGDNQILKSVDQELKNYFAGTSTSFNTPISLHGTAFQQSVWQQLLNIPFGETRSYLDLANALHHAKAVRAVAQANAANPIAIFVPCHRVINTNGDLGGYAGGIDRKEYLLTLEKAHITQANA